MPSLYINIGEVLWRSSDSCVTLSIRCNCTSTAFAPHKHGGEKGVHMRLQVDTFELLPDTKLAKSDLDMDSTSSSSPPSSRTATGGSSSSSSRKHLCSSYCRIQLFRLKGAQRKLKTDKAKIERLNPIDLRRRYQQSMKFTQLYNAHFDALYSIVPIISETNTANSTGVASSDGVPSSPSDMMSALGGPNGAGLMGLVDPHDAAVAASQQQFAAAGYPDFSGSDCPPPGSIMNDFLETSLSATSTLINSSGSSIVYNSLGYFSFYFSVNSRQRLHVYFDDIMYLQVLLIDRKKSIFDLIDFDVKIYCTL